MIYTYSTIKDIEMNNRQAMEKFLTELRTCNIMDKQIVDANADPNINFECL